MIQERKSLDLLLPSFDPRRRQMRNEALSMPLSILFLIRGELSSHKKSLIEKKTVWTLATIRQQVLTTIWRPNSGEFCHLTMQITDGSVLTKFGRYNQVDSCWKGTFRTRLLVLFAIDVLVVTKFYCTLFYYNHQYQINHKAE